MRRAALPLLLAAAALLAGCATPRRDPVTFPPQTFGPGAPVSAAVDQTRGEIVRALAARGLQATDPAVPFRPPEAAVLAAAPRRVIQVQLPEDREHGFISIYDLRSPAAAADAARAQATYLGSGFGRAQFPPDTRITLRQVGSTVVFYAWSPGSSPDPDTPRIEEVLATVGLPVAVPR